VDRREVAVRPAHPAVRARPADRECRDVPEIQASLENPEDRDENIRRMICEKSALPY